MLTNTLFSSDTIATATFHNLRVCTTNHTWMLGSNLLKQMGICHVNILMSLQYLFTILDGDEGMRQNNTFATLLPHYWSINKN